MTGPAKLRRVLQLVFRQQARDAATKITPAVLDHGRTPDLHHWVAATAAVIRPAMLEIFQSGLLHTAAKLGLRAEPRLGPAAQAVAAASDRRHEVGNDEAFGQRKNLGFESTKLFRRQVFKAAGLGGTFDIFNPRVLDAVDAACMVLCRSTLETATTDLETAIERTRQVLRQGLPRGEAMLNLARGIQTIFADPKRAELIALTESTRALNGGRLLAAADSGRVAEKVWVASANSCEQCLELDGRRVKLHDPFIVVGHGPYSQIFFPPLHPRCDCSFEELFNDNPRRRVA